MRFDRPLEVGAAGGHGPIGYVVEEIVPNRSITFRFTKPEGFDGIHRFDILPHTESSVLLRHTIEAELRGLALLKWSLAIRPLHDALLEDCLATARASLGEEPRIQPWSARVKILRWIMSGGKKPRQRTPRVSQKTHPEGTS